METSKRNNRPDGRKQLGSQGEQLAARYLTEQGYTLLTQNWRCRTGEIDLVAEDGEVIVFVEVRTRKATGRFGTAQESVDYRKRRQVTETAQVFLLQRGLQEKQIRFDVIAIHMQDIQQAPGEIADGHRLEHIVNAF
ncbi:YraN family protein [Paenibacillus thalictri]|uniref:UPF0102 protein EYB31_16330 n=1 Tax=Paenibacillus thalictri TaxID=2527873 RepID=A0A4V2J444_9BACL|nr:YraN family protein [Paenibacillus thalictri]TBL77709.1 YraN family protein [Paenibacillus thalictri]